MWVTTGLPWCCAPAVVLTSLAGYHPPHPVTRLAQIAGLHTHRLALGKSRSNTNPSYLQVPRGAGQG